MNQIFSRMTITRYMRILLLTQFKHDTSITSIGIVEKGQVEKELFVAWLSELLQKHGVDIFRTKGILNLKGEEKMFVFQGVHMLLDTYQGKSWTMPDTQRENRVCFIGRNLDKLNLEEGFQKCLLK